MCWTSLTAIPIGPGNESQQNYEQEGGTVPTKEKTTTDKPRLPTIKPTEWKAIAALLESPADSSEVLAKTIIHELDSLRGKTQQWAVILQLKVNSDDDEIRYNAATYMIYGPFPTKSAAEKAAGALLGTYGASVGIRVGRLVNELQIAADGQPEGVWE